MIYRQVNRSFQSEFDHFIDSGLYDQLVDGGLLVSHLERQVEPAEPHGAYKILEPQPIRFISYPYEWCFSQLKDAALLTLAIQRKALQAGQVLKDASAYNVQFQEGQPIWVDTLSFEPWQEGQPWIAYRQFCQHFLAPLALVAYKDLRLDRLLRGNLDGVALDMTSRLLPFRTRLQFRLLTHLHFHARAQARYANREIEGPSNARRMSRNAMLGLVDDLESAIRALKWDPQGSPWTDYTDTHNYSATAMAQKRQLVAKYLDHASPETVWDLGANTGEFSRLATDRHAQTIAFDIDPGAVEANYQISKVSGNTRMQPLLMDLTNPSPSLGWESRERQSLLDRAPADLVMALALIHHLAISNNVPLPMLAEFLTGLGNWLIIEFVPKEDSQIQRLLRSRKDIFVDYHLAGFSTAFSEYFSIELEDAVGDSGRWLYLMRKRAK